MFTLIQTAKLNDVDPQAWLADVLARIADHNSQRLAAPALELESCGSTTRRLNTPAPQSPTPRPLPEGYLASLPCGV